MSRIVNETQTFHPSGLEVLDVNGTSVEVSNVNRFIGEVSGSTNSNNYAQYYLVTGTSAETFGWVSMECSSLPRNITINNVTGKYKIYHGANTTYISVRQIRPYYNNRQTAKGFSVNLSASTTVAELSMGTSWTRDMFDDLQFRIYSRRTGRNTTSNYYVRPYGIDVTVEYEYTMYEFTCNSSLGGVGMSPSSGETMSGDSYTVTITGITDISTVIIKDNGVDITNTFTKSGNNYVKTYSSVSTDHALTIESSVVSYQVNASSTYAGATITANPVSVQEGGSCLLTLTTSDISRVSVVDNGSDITSQFTGSNGTFTYTLTNVITAHTIVVSEVTKKLYMKIDGVMKSVSRIHMKTNNVWTSISFVDFWRKVNGVYVNGEAVSGTTFLIYGGEMESTP